MQSFAPGQEIIVRDLIYGKEFSKWPYQVIEDNGNEVRGLLRPGTTGLAPSLWVKSLQDNDPGARAELHGAFARQSWEMSPWTWQRYTRLRIMYADRYFAIDSTWDEDGSFAFWYVNFQVPFVRTADGLDTSDLHLDLVVQPDLSYAWKDEDEYAEAISLGLVPEEWQKSIASACEQAVAMVEQRQGPFSEDWSVIPGARPIPAGGQL